MPKNPNVDKLARRAEKYARYFESRPNHHKTVIVVCLSVLLILFVLNIKSVFWMTLLAGIVYIIGLRVWRGKVVYVQPIERKPAEH
jgi:hypothetical protein